MKRMHNREKNGIRLAVGLALAVAVIAVVIVVVYLVRQKDSSQQDSDSLLVEKEISSETVPVLSTLSDNSQDEPATDTEFIENDASDTQMQTETVDSQSDTQVENSVTETQQNQSQQVENPPQAQPEVKPETPTQTVEVIEPQWLYTGSYIDPSVDVSNKERLDTLANGWKLGTVSDEEMEQAMIDFHYDNFEGDISGINWGKEEKCLFRTIEEAQNFSLLLEDNMANYYFVSVFTKGEREAGYYVFYVWEVGVV